MIPIKIGKKKFNIKSIDELTTSEFIELSKIDNCDTIKYIAWQTGESFDSAFFAVTSKSLDIAIGKAPDVTKLPKPKWPDYTKTIDTVGQRHQVENSGKQDFELLVYCLAVSQARSNNSDQVNELEKEYLQRPFQEILPAGFFFFKSYKYGKKNVLTSLRLLLYSMMTPKSKRLRELKG